MSRSTMVTVRAGLSGYRQAELEDLASYLGDEAQRASSRALRVARLEAKARLELEIHRRFAPVDWASVGGVS